jgi:hypothetical protein
MGKTVTGEASTFRLLLLLLLLLFACEEFCGVHVVVIVHNFIIVLSFGFSAPLSSSLQSYLLLLR